MKNSNPKMVKILNERTSKFQCRVCGKVWWANINPDTGKFYRGSWQCPMGCKLKDLKERGVKFEKG